MTASPEPGHRQYQQALHMSAFRNSNKSPPYGQLGSVNSVSSNNQHVHPAGNGSKRPNRGSLKASPDYLDHADSPTKNFEANISRVKRPIGGNDTRSEVLNDDEEESDSVFSNSSSSDENDNVSTLLKIYFDKPHEKRKSPKKNPRKNMSYFGKTVPKTQRSRKGNVAARQLDTDEEPDTDGFNNPFAPRLPKYSHRGSKASDKTENGSFPGERPLNPPSEGEECTVSTSPRSILLETRFYHYLQEFDRSERQHHLRSEGQDAFRSEFGPRCILRAAYGPSSLQGARPLELPEGNEIWAIRIYSKPVSAFLKDIVDDKINLGHIIEMCYPFRTLIRNAGAFRDHAKKLERKYSTKLTFERPEFVYETETALDHFRHLVQFMDKYLGIPIQSYEGFRQGRYDKIKFRDLWMLYDANSIIYTPDSRNKDISGERSFSCSSIMPQYKQAYKVLSTVGGIRFRSELMRMQTQKKAMRGGLNQLKPGQSAKIYEEYDQHDIKLGYSALHVNCYCLDYNTKEWGVNFATFEFTPFEGEREINSLPAYPIHETHEFWGNLIRRGRDFVKMINMSHWEHEGFAVSDVCGGENISGPVITDLVLASKRLYSGLADLGIEFRDMKSHQFPPKGDEVTEITSPHHDSVIDVYRDIQRKILSRTHDMLEDFFEKLEQITRRASVDELTQYLERHDSLMLLPGVTVCYALRSRQWVIVDIENLTPVRAIPGWDGLALPKGHKELLEAIVEANIAQNRNLGGFNIKSEVDFVHGQKNGSIILLHGAPGMGKTSTAECVAASTNRPLFHIACGDIGHEPWQVENNLRDLFDLAYRWGCILLLEEADVFLARRNENLSRNSIVSVFLRVLEYYSGILFLTTNHVGSIDDAFHSRFHLMLYYPRLSKRQSCKVWEINLDNLEEQSKIRIQSGRLGIKMDRTKILAYANNSYERLSWNGRQIRNAFQTALALAESRVRNKEVEEPVVGTDGFRIIAASVDNFGYRVKQALYQDQNRIVHHDRTRTDDSALKYWLRNRAKYESSYHDDEDEDTAQIWERNNSGSPMDESDSAGSDSLDESSDAYARRESSRIKSKAKGKRNIGKESRNRKDWERRKDEGGFQR